MSWSRRQFIQRGAGTAAMLALGSASGCVLLPKGQRERVVVVGGGFAGATAARFLADNHPTLNVTLIEANSRYYACPFSNMVLAGERSLARQTFGYEALSGSNVRLLTGRVEQIDPVRHEVELEDGRTAGYDKLILAPGISLNYSALSGYSAAAANVMPHAWQGSAQMRLLREQLERMPDGGTVVISVPEEPYRCPPGPYERASLIAHYLKQHKARSKVLVLDSKDRFSKQSLFQEAWQLHYGDLLEWQGLADGARVIAVDAERNLVQTEFDQVQADVANIIPPQRAGRVALTNGLTDASGWCPVDALTFESSLAKDIHVIGDAAILNAMPKSAFAANAQAKLCAVQVVRMMAGKAPVAAPLMNTCYSLVTPEAGISVADVYEAEGALWQPVPGAGGTSPLAASAPIRRQEAHYAHDWFDTITGEVFG